MVFEQRLSDLPFPSRLFIYPVPKVPGSTTTCRLLRHYDRRVPYAMCSWHHHVEYWAAINRSNIILTAFNRYNSFQRQLTDQIYKIQKI
ncbi:hypothetical protein E1A91_A06G198000v1 [Gossypium mustelinum]|uniref:Uncharacterized protein n=1 Tax=Gossypium mustelinum TaxID=34275 RepID=A0A5D2YY33_GOSMU|nr:hypothetical protein E1A91_A06G198000v1 [Gossypium mustelinum]